MNIVCIGCSYTAGMPENWYSWPESLANLRPNDTVYNLAIGGSSLILSIYILDSFLKTNTADKVIFQITHPHRFTSIDSTFSIDKSLQKENNYIRIDPYVRGYQNLMTVTPGDVTMKWSKSYEKIKFAKQYYRFYSKDLGSLEHNFLIDAVKNRSDFYFEYKDIPEDARQQTMDDSGHFNDKGHNIIAEWINNELERNIH